MATIFGSHPVADSLSVISYPLYDRSDLRQHLFVVEAVEVRGVHPAGGHAYPAPLAQDGIDDSRPLLLIHRDGAEGVVPFAQAAGHAAFLVDVGRLPFCLDEIIRQDRAGPRD